MEVDQSDLWGVARVQDRSRNTLIPSSEARKARQLGFKVNRLQSVRHSATCVRADGVIELHVDDEHGFGKETIAAELFTLLSEKIEMKHVQGIWCGSYEYLKAVKMRDGEEIDERPKQEASPVSVEKVGDERVQGERFSHIEQGVHRW